MTATVGEPFKLAAWVTDEGAKINVPPATGRRPGPGGAAPAEAPAGPPAPIWWSVFRGPGTVKFDPGNPKVDVANAGETSTTACIPQRLAITFCGCRRMTRRAKAAAAFSAAGQIRTFA
jgi:hypothetical protein